jgi:hypothetical protein
MFVLVAPRTLHHHHLPTPTLISGMGMPRPMMNMMGAPPPGMQPGMMGEMPALIFLVEH